MDRRLRILVTVVAVGALVAPVVLDRDSFPLSTYPMYARVRGDEVTFATAHAVGPDRERSSLTLEVIGDSDDPLIVAGELRRAVRDGRAQARCHEIAERARQWDALPDGTTTIEVVTERHAVVAAVSGQRSLRDRTVHASCKVPSA